VQGVFVLVPALDGGQGFVGDLLFNNTGFILVVGQAKTPCGAMRSRANL
jgi:hypothetical protein